MFKVEKKVLEIIKELKKKPEGNEIRSSLFTGDSGIALFLFYCSKYFNDYVLAKLAMDYLSIAVKAIDINKTYSYSFCEGISGITWCIDHLIKNNFIECENEEILNAFDNFLCQRTLIALKSGNNDFLHGAIGSAVYLLNRIHNTDVNETLKKIVILLKDEMCFDGENFFWKYFFGSKSDSKTCNICLSHGMAGTGLFLVKACNLGINRTLILEILSKVNSFLLSQENSAKVRNSMFPSFSLKHGLEGSWGLNSRLGWCYGDLGLGLFFWHYSKLIKSIELENKAIEIFLFSANRIDLKINSVFDGGICHGTAGISLFFRRIFYLTKIEEFNKASEYWLMNTLLMSKYEDGLAGFKANDKNIEYGFLEGISGIGLVFLSYLADEEPIWDECLLLS